MMYSKNPVITGGSAAVVYCPEYFSSHSRHKYRNKFKDWTVGTRIIVKKK